jgi:hypothetical protein
MAENFIRRANAKDAKLGLNTKYENDKKRLIKLNTFNEQYEVIYEILKEKYIAYKGLKKA